MISAVKPKTVFLILGSGVLIAAVSLWASLVSLAKMVADQ